MQAWYAKVSPHRHRLFVGRHYCNIDLEDGVMTVTTRRGGVVYMGRTDLLELVRVGNGPLLQVLVQDPDQNMHIFEFRPRRHAVGRALADALR